MIWPIATERPKTLWLLEGLKQLGIKIIKSSKWILKLRPSQNPRGPYVYPIEFAFGERHVLALYDIGTVPENFYVRLMAPNRYYFKVHLRKKDQKKFPRLFPAPNSASQISYLGQLERLKKLKDDKEYYFDFFFNGWNDDRGLRLWTIQKARNQKWNQYTGLMPFKHHTKVPDFVISKRLPYLDHLSFQAKSKINLALPGGFSEPWCSFRHVELWGMGSFVLTKKLDSRLVGLPGDSFVEYDKSNFVEIVNYYLTHDDEREAIAMRGRQYFDEYLTPQANAKHIIDILHTLM